MTKPFGSVLACKGMGCDMCAMAPFYWGSDSVVGVVQCTYEQWVQPYSLHSPLCQLPVLVIHAELLWPAFCC